MAVIRSRPRCVNPSYTTCHELHTIFLSRRVLHYNYITMSAVASQINGLTIVYSTLRSRRRSNKISKLRVTGLCAENSPVTGEFPTQRAEDAENVSIWWRHHGQDVAHFGVTILNRHWYKVPHSRSGWPYLIGVKMRSVMISKKYDKIW